MNTQVKTVSTGIILMMAIAVCATVANLYYNQPLLPLMGRTMGIDESHSVS